MDEIPGPSTWADPFAAVKGTAYSRASGDLVKVSLRRLLPIHLHPLSGPLQLDLQDEEAVEAFLADFQPEFVVHCAAERRPDAVEAVRSLLDGLL